MKKNLIVFASLLAAFFLGNNVMATVVVTASATGTATATARIVQPLEIVKQADLAFGNIAAGIADGSVTIALDGSRSGMGGVTLIAAGNVNSAASFDIQGYPGASFTIDLPSSIDIESGNDEMEVDNFVSSLGATNSLSNQGTATLVVGATLNVEANQAPGLYSGTFDVVVAYN